MTDQPTTLAGEPSPRDPWEIGVGAYGHMITARPSDMFIQVPHSMRITDRAHALQYAAGDPAPTPSDRRRSITGRAARARMANHYFSVRATGDDGYTRTFVGRHPAEAERKAARFMATQPGTRWRRWL